MGAHFIGRRTISEVGDQIRSTIGLIRRGGTLAGVIDLASRQRELSGAYLPFRY
jgi:hypothetical protein